jgi:hypothetical protein
MLDKVNIIRKKCFFIKIFDSFLPEKLHTLSAYPNKTQLKEYERGW